MYTLRVLIYIEILTRVRAPRGGRKAIFHISKTTPPSEGGSTTILPV